MIRCSAKAISFLIFFIFGSLCFSQKTVPDSLRCISPTQVNTHIENYYIIQEQKQSLALRDSTINTLYYAISECNESNKNWESQVNLHLLRNSNLRNDNEYLAKQLLISNRKINIQKVLLYILGGIIVTETGYLGVISVVK